MTTLFILITFALGFGVGYAYHRYSLNHLETRFPSSPFSKQDGDMGREAIAKRIEKRKALIVEQARTQGRITNDDVEELLLVSDATASNYLSELEEKGKLTQEGDGRSTYYVSANP
ncbi:MAG TPA: hypothetical protein ENI66_01610 [Candidatus Yonathbacteria bacterium]|nr:hypothetical protein [Candidatus Yonathbacteria bacterium]